MSHRTPILLLVLLISGAAAHASAEPAHHTLPASRADSHAPLGVMGDHVHAAGEWMFSYRYARMTMEGNRDGTKRLGTSAVRSQYGFPVVPTDMDMEMHVFGAMWAPSDAVTLMAMLPLRRLDMKHRTPSGAGFTTRSKGLGDVRLAALVPLWDGEGQRLHANLGVSLPTGSLSEKDDTPMGRVRLPYPMQLGSGTWDLLPGLTWTGEGDAFSWGSQLRATWRTGVNNKGYRLGHEWGATAWLARRLGSAFSTSLRLDWSDWANIRGDDDALSPGVVPTADPDRRGGQRLDVLLGFNALVSSGPLRGHRLALELGAPLYQDLDGPQLETDWRLVFGWQKAF